MSRLDKTRYQVELYLCSWINNNALPKASLCALCSFFSLCESIFCWQQHELYLRSCLVTIRDIPFATKYTQASIFNLL